MALGETLQARRDGLGARGRLAPLGFVALAVLVALWAWRAFHDASTHDAGLAYVGGQVAWASGRPERWFSWTGAPFFAAVMGLVTRLASDATAADLLTALNIVLVVGAVAVVLRRLRGVLSQAWWWAVAVALLTFGPILSSVWWKQINVVCIVLALGGFELLRRGREHAGAGLIAVSVALKPLAILLPFVLLARRQTRRAAAWSLFYLVALNLGAQVLLAAHAHDSSALNPLLALKNFSHKSKPAAGLACSPENFSPQSLLCRLAGPQLDRPAGARVGRCGAARDLGGRRPARTQGNQLGAVCLHVRDVDHGEPHRVVALPDHARTLVRAAGCAGLRTRGLMPAYGRDSRSRSSSPR